MIILTMKLTMFLHIIFLNSFVVAALPRLQERDADQNSCDHPDCLQFATKLVAGINWSTKPCDDFFQFACGRWIKNADNPTTSPILNDMFLQRNNVRGRIKEIIVSEIEEKESALNKAKNMYMSCVNKKNGVKENIKQLQKIIYQFGGWKLGSVDRVNKEDAINLIVNVAYSTEISVPLSVGGNTVNNNHSIYFPWLVQPKPEDLLTSPYLYPSLTEEDIVSIGEIIFGVKDKTRAIQDAKDVLQLDNVFRQLIDKDGKKQVSTIGKTKINQEINLVSFINAIFTPVKKFTTNDLMLVYTESYFQQFFFYINNPRNARAVYNYIMVYQTMESLRLIGRYLPSPLREIKGVKVGNISPRYDCLEAVKICFDVAIAHKYGELYHDINKEIEMINELTQDFMKEFSIRLDQLDWLDEPSKQAAHRKVANISPHYEYPKWAMDLNKVNEHYENITSTGNWIGDSAECMRFSNRLRFLKAIEPPRGHVIWESSPLEVNAFYNAYKNDIHILEAILEDPIFNVNRLRLMNYAGIGSFVGHEIVHGFDNNGVQYDETGLRRSWLTKESQEEFNKRTQCLVDQYSNFKLTNNDLRGPMTEYKVNGALTLGENIADDGGLKISYFAYQQWVKNNKPEILPDILRKNFTEEQTFFLSFARTWCVQYEYGVRKIDLEGEHSPDKFRVNGPLSNFDKFAEAYNCPSGSPMVRGEKSCHVW